MSQNDPGGFDRDFLDSDVDLQIAHPSPGAEIYSRSSSFSFMSARVIVAILLIAGGALGGVYYVGYKQGLAEGQRSLPPIVLAENTPIKVPPEQVPGGISPEADDLNIYGVMRGTAKQTETTPRDTLPADNLPADTLPADNAPGTIESLIAQTDDPFTEALEGAPKQEETLPPGNSITVLRERSDVKVQPPRPELNRAPKAEVKAKAGTEAVAESGVEAGAETGAETGESKPPPQPKPVARQDYMVQLAASRSRALARGIYSNLQKNYNDLLGRRNPLILRVDLGDKGVFYRVNVPGFANRNAANVFCANLKKRGRDCLVRKQP